MSELEYLTKKIENKEELGVDELDKFISYVGYGDPCFQVRANHE